MLASGCGDGASKPADEQAAAAAKARKQTFVAKADQVCLDFRKDLASAPGGDVARQARRTRVLAARTLDRLRALNPPEKDRPVLLRYLASLEASVRTTLPALEAAARKGHDAKADRLTAELARRGDQQRELARRYGFNACGARPSS